MGGKSFSMANNKILYRTSAFVNRNSRGKTHFFRAQALTESPSCQAPTTRAALFHPWDVNDAAGLFCGFKCILLYIRDSFFVKSHCKRYFSSSEISFNNAVISGIEALGTCRVRPTAQMAARRSLLLALMGMAKATIPSMYSSRS